MQPPARNLGRLPRMLQTHAISFLASQGSPLSPSYPTSGMSLPPAVPAAVLMSTMTWTTCRCPSHLPGTARRVHPNVHITPTCRYENFFHFALAHLFLYGLLKDWVKLWNDSGNPKNRADARTVMKDDKPSREVMFALPTYIRRQIVLKLWRIVPTRQWSMYGANVDRCCISSTCCDCCPFVPGEAWSADVRVSAALSEMAHCAVEGPGGWKM